MITFLTSKMHVGQDDLLTDTRKDLFILKQTLAVITLCHGTQKLDRMTHHLQGSDEL